MPGRRGKPTPREFASMLRDQIRRGEFRPGQRLPTEREFAAQYDVGRHVIHRALDQLDMEGWVEQRIGNGTYVPPLPPMLPLPLERAVYRDERGIYLTPAMKEWDLLAPTRIAYEPAPPAIVVLLGLEAGAEVLVRDRQLGPPGTSPAEQLSASYLPADLTRGVRLEQPDTGPTGILGLLEADGHRFAFRPSVGSRRPLEEEARALGISMRVPLLVQWITASNQDGRPLVVTEYRWSSKRYVLMGDPLREVLQEGD